jgi:hypothetical protein
MSTIPTSFVPDEVDVIEQDLDDNLDGFAPLAARHEGQMNMWEHRRKMELAKAREAVRLKYAKDGEKISEARTDDLARVSLDYQAFIDEGENERIEYHRQKNIRIEHYIRRRELEQRGMR